MTHIITITWARNEEDILEAFVRHNAPYIDRMIIVLHRSIDSSQDILLKLIQEGYPLEIAENNTYAHRQSAALTTLMHEISHRKNPDWILPLDADEFLIAPSRISFEQALSTLPPDTGALLPWRTYIPTVNDPSHQKTILRSIGHRRKEEIAQFYKICIPRYIAQNSDTVIPLGSHTLLNKTHEELVPTIQLSSVQLGHFPVRTEQQLRQKVINGWDSHCANPNRNPGEIFQWEMLYERCRDPAPISPEELQEIALWYAIPKDRRNTVNEIVYDPVPDVCLQSAKHV